MIRDNLTLNVLTLILTRLIDDVGAGQGAAMS
jgi:hypothetical protein